MKRIIVFVLLTMLCSAPWWWLAREHGGSGYITLMMWSPALAAALTIKVTGGKLSELGWRGAHLGWALVAILIPAVAYGTSYAGAYASGVLSFPSADGLIAVGRATGITPPNTFALAWYAVMVCTTGAIKLTGPALGEELGWRGLLAPAMCAKFGFGWGSLLVGFIWAAWHFPLFIGRAEPMGYVNFTVSIVGLSFALSWLRFCSNSVWPAALLHGAANSIGLAFVSLTADSPGNDAWLDDTGYVLGGVGVVMTIVFWLLGRKLKISPIEGDRNA